MNIVILAAGQGKRMRSRLPKVLQPLAGRPMLSHVIDAARVLAEQQPNPRIVLVVGHVRKRSSPPWRPKPTSVLLCRCRSSALATP